MFTAAGPGIGSSDDQPFGRDDLEVVNGALLARRLKGETGMNGATLFGEGGTSERGRSRH